MRLVLDTNVVLSALLWHGTPHRLVARAQEEDIAFYTSRALLAELAAILGRNKFAKALTVNHTTVDEVLRAYAGFAHVVKTPPIEPVIDSDPDDDQVLACAMAAKAELIVSGDSDLLAVKEYRGIRIVTPAEALRRIGAS